MTQPRSVKGEAVAFHNESGSWYLIPVEDRSRYQISEEEVPKLKEVLEEEDEVRGFIPGSNSCPHCAELPTHQTPHRIWRLFRFPLRLS